MARVTSVEGGMFNSRPARAQKTDVTMMMERSRDELPAIQELWPRFEPLVGLRGRRMYAMISAGTYAACTPVRDGDDPARPLVEYYRRHHVIDSGCHPRSVLTSPGCFARQQTS